MNTHVQTISETTIPETAVLPAVDFAHQPLQTIVLGGGCFWCIDAFFRLLRGVHRVTSGYSGGSTPNPTYEAVCSGTTGHAEVVEIEYDESILSSGQLLDIFFAAHDGTQLNRQGADVGTQYRSVIYYTTPAQAAAAHEKIRELDTYAKPIVTEVAPLQNFYPAESYHQNYYQENSWQPYCAFTIGPKLKKLKKQFQELLKLAETSV